VEIVTAPLKIGDERLVGKYREFFTNSNHIKVHDFNLAIADETAKIRAHYGIKTPDAIQLATAKMMGADIVLSNDLQWKKMKELRIILLDELL
jgi:predicted nucleic acid-binding protein